MAVSLLCAAPITARAADSVVPPPPPYLGAYQPQGVDEIGLWRDEDEEEKALANSPTLIRDEALNSYVRGLLCNTVGADRCQAARIYILRMPIPNASMAPNGTMRIFSGMFLRTRNEAELATILGHEFGHFEQRHSLSQFKARRSSSDLVQWAQVLAGIGGTRQAFSDFNQLQLSVYGRLSRFGRDQEREADRFSIAYLNGSNMRPQAASAFWQNMMDEATASSRSRGLNKPDFHSVALFASHPPDGERAVSMAVLANPDAQTRDDGAARYRTALASWMPAFLDDQIKLNDFGASDHIIASLAEAGWTGPLWLARGDLYRMRGNPRDLILAAEFYGKALEADPALPEASRGLGLSLLKTGRPSEGKVALRRYLDLKPDAADAGAIRMLASVEE